ncbi:MAG: type III-B CRISPR module-associated protein Cmr5 [Bacteroidota bacterium]
MNREVEDMLPAALEAVKRHLMMDKERGIAYKEYDGYAASLGATIRQSGLFPALSFFTDVHKMKRDTQNKVYRHRLLMAILDSLGKELPDHQDDYKKNQLQGRALLVLVIKSVYGKNAMSITRSIELGQSVTNTHVQKWEHDIMVASVAIKLALRTFVHTGSNLAKI